MIFTFGLLTMVRFYSGLMVYGILIVTKLLSGYLLFVSITNYVQIGMFFKFSEDFHLFCSSIQEYVNKHNKSLFGLHPGVKETKQVDHHPSQYITMDIDIDFYEEIRKKFTSILVHSSVWLVVAVVSGAILLLFVCTTLGLHDRIVLTIDLINKGGK